MKKILHLLLAASALAFAGCMTQSGAAKKTQENAINFARFLVDHDIEGTGIKHSFGSAAWSNSESIAEISKTFDGGFTITALNANLEIPRIFGGGITNDFSIASLKIKKSDLPALPSIMQAPTPAAPVPSVPPAPAPTK